MIKIRKPAVAGAFYPASKGALTNQIDEYLAKARRISTTDNLEILIVPHAGYDYSGQVAAWGFKQISQKYERVILVGISHYSYFKGTAIWNKGNWQTPLGVIETDEDLATKLASLTEEFKINPEVHLYQEHSLEVELPFLQRVLKNFRIVPILLGQLSEEALQDLAQTLTKNFNNKTLLVISSDLSHYPPYNVAKSVDNQTIKAILAGDINNFDRLINKNLAQPGVETCACGAQGIKMAMLLAKELRINKVKLLKYINSGDVSGDKSRVVGYAAIGFYGLDKKSSNPEKLNKKQQLQLLKIARETLKTYLKDRKIPQFDVTDKQLNQKLGVFVTLRRQERLRGCIGEFKSNEPLYQLIGKKAIDAAINDPRFYPVQYSELSSVKIEISVLSPMKRINDWKKIELGKDGVFIKNGQKCGTFLPQVAQESGWSKEDFLAHLCFDKAGLPADAYKDLKTQIFTYTAQVFGEE